MKSRRDNNKMTIILITLIIFTLMFSIFSILYYHRLWNPILLCTTMLLLGIILALDNCSPKDMEVAMFWILIGETFLLSSFFIMQIFFNKRTTKEEVSNITYNLSILKKLISVNIVVSILGLLVNTYSVMQIAPSFRDIFVNSTYIRYLYLQRSSGAFITILGLLLTLNFFVTFIYFPIALQNGIKRTVPKLIFVLAIRLSSSLITMSKEAFLIDIIYFVSAYMIIIKSKKEEFNFYKKYGVVFGFLIVLLLVVISFQRNYIGGGRYAGYGDAIIGTLRTYISVSIEAFGKLLNLKSITFTDGSLCFRPIFNILSYLGVGTRVSIIQDALTNIVNVNVYTAFGNMYRDFSFAGIIILSTVFGGFLGAIYNTKHKYKSSHIVINSIIIMTMFFIYYDLKIIQTIYVFVMVYAVIVDKIIANKLYIKHV